MTISFVRLTSATNDASSTTLTSTFAANGAGNLCVIGVFWNDPAGTITVSSVTDDNSNTWHALTKVRNATQQFSEQIWYAYNVASDAGTVTITATYSASADFRRIQGGEYTSSNGAFTTDPFESPEGSGTGNGTAMATGTITPALNNEMIVCAGSNPGGNITAGTSFTRRAPSSATSTAFADHIQTTATAETAKLTCSGSGQWGIAGAKFKDVSGSVTITPGAVNATTTFPSATKSGGATVTPAAILGSTTFPAAVVTAGGTTVTPSAVLATTSFPAATKSGGASVAPAAILASTSFPTKLVATTNSTPIELLIEAAYGADPDSDLSAAVWTDITRLVRYESGAVVRAGRHGLGQTTEPLQIRLVIDNRNGAHTPFLNTGLNWPYITRNLPIRVSAAFGGAVPVQQATAFVDSYELAWDDSTNDCVVNVIAVGRLGRLSRKKVAVSAAGGTVNATAPVAYWPLTDGTSASQAASGLPGGLPMTKSGSLKFGTGQGLTGQPNILDLGALKNTIGSLRAAIPAGTSETSWRVEFQLCWADLDATDDAIGPNWSTAGTIAGWQIYYRHSDDRITLRYTLDGSGSSVELDTSKTNPYDGVTRVYRVTADQNGSGIDVALTINGVSYLSTTIASQTLGRPIQAKLRTCFFFDSGYDGSQAPAVGHYTFWAPYLAPSSDTLLAASGYASELAADRIARLCDESGVPVTVMDGDSSAMGPQGDGKLLDLLRECEAADGGLLHDNGTDGALVYIPRSARYNALVDLTVDVDLKELQPGFRPTYDGRDTLTAAVVSQPGGSSGSYEVPDAEGDEDRTYSLNLDDSEDLTQHAAWRVNVGTVAGMRYPRVGLNFRRTPELMASWLAGDRVGMRLNVTNLPQQHPPLPVAQFAEGFEMRLTTHWWSVDLDCVPAAPYEVMVLSTSAATLLAAVDSDDTAWSSVVDAPPRWTTTDVPLALTCGGEDPIVATAIADVAQTYVAAGTAAHADNASVTPTLPVGVTAGDLLLIVAAIRSSGTGTPDTPTGYTRMAGWHNLRLFGKIHTGSESNPTVTFTGGSAGDTTSADMIALRGTVADPAEAIIDWADYLNTSAANIAYPPLPTPLWDGCVLLAIGWKQDDWTSVAALAGWTEAFDISSTTGSDQGLVCDYQIQTTATAIASGSFTVTGGTSQISRALMVVIAPGRSTLTVTRATNGTAIAHSAGDAIEVSSPGIVAL